MKIITTIKKSTPLSYVLLLKGKDVVELEHVAVRKRALDLLVGPRDEELVILRGLWRKCGGSKRVRSESVIFTARVSRALSLLFWTPL